MSEHHTPAPGSQFLPEAEIERRMLLRDQKVSAMLDEKLNDVKKDVGQRLDKQDTEIADIRAIVERIDRKGDEWNAQDLKWRDTVMGRVSKLEAAIRSLRVWIALVSAAIRLQKIVTVVIKSGREAWVAIAAIASTIVAVVQFVHTVWPDYLHPFLLHHHIMHH